MSMSATMLVAQGCRVQLLPSWYCGLCLMCRVPEPLSIAAAESSNTDASSVIYSFDA